MSNLKLTCELWTNQWTSYLNLLMWPNVVFQDNEKTRDIMIDHRYHKTIIGAQGANIRGIREKFSSVVISFPDPNKQSDVVSLRGPKTDVDQCYKHLHQIAQNMVGLSFRII